MLISAGELISKSVDLYKKNLKLFLIFVVIFLIPTAIMEIIGFLMGYSSMKPDFSAVVGAGFGLGYTLLGILVALANLWISLAFIKVMASIITGSPVKSVMEELIQAKKFFFPALLASILGGLAIFGGMILLIIPGIIFAVWFAFAVYSVVLDNKDAVESLKDSKALVHGRWWDVFWRLLAPGVVFAIIAMVIQWLVSLVFSPLSSVLGFVGVFIYGLVVAFAGLLIMPLSTAAPTMLYLELRKAPVKANVATESPVVKKESEMKK